MRRRVASLGSLAAALSLALTTALTVAPAQANPLAGPGQQVAAQQTADIRLLAINSFGGALSPPEGPQSTITRPDGTTAPAGGAAYLSAYLEQLRATSPNSLLFTVGDNVGSTPLESSLFHDEPTIEFLNSLNIATSAIGNHELDAGFTELLRLKNGGCHPVDGCQFGEGFSGARFPIVASNIVFDNGRPATLPFTVNFAGTIPVGTIAITPADTPSRVTPDGVAGLRFTDEITEINRTADLLDFLGVKTIVLLLHEGIPTEGCDAAGRVHEVASAASPKVDVIFTGQNSGQYNCVLPDPDGRPRSVLQSNGRGRGVSVADVTVDLATGEVLRDRVATFNQVVTRDITPNPTAAALVARAEELSAETSQRPIGEVSEKIDRHRDETGQSALGNLVADAQLAATTASGAQVALTNPGGLRASLEKGPVNYASAHNVQPFRNQLRTLTLTGAQLNAVLEQQFRSDGDVVLAPSANLAYDVSAAAPAGQKVRNLRIAGVEVARDALVRVTVNKFLAEGGDGFTELAKGVDVVGGPTDLGAFADYLSAASPVAAPARNRIGSVN
ncbi:bifunctional metallophosphatase/5'-nucleotidase [Tomitella biformata]|uniref:bifunctional metallophosphatase/5'-nucleotidase n=1 Tax=Tomitella biformata TaxID=630403 RepID=UPI00046675E9|nr:bifunctional UDP-sugar hydrolase/5'-nucleotidase [Tomitella biformata]